MNLKINGRWFLMEIMKPLNGKMANGCMLTKPLTIKIDMNGADPYLGKPPVGDPILDNKGNRDEKKLQEKSDKNKKKEDPRSPVNNDN